MNYPAASRRGITKKLVLQFAASSGELTPKWLEGVADEFVIKGMNILIFNPKKLMFPMNHFFSDYNKADDLFNVISSDRKLF
jgi:hypothetical protein